MVDQLVGFSLCCLVTLVEFLENLSSTTRFAKQRQPVKFFEMLSNEIRSFMFFTYIPTKQDQSTFLLKGFETVYYNYCEKLNLLLWSAQRLPTSHVSLDTYRGTRGGIEPRKWRLNKFCVILNTSRDI